MSIRKSMSLTLWTFNTRRWRPSKEDLLLATSCIQSEEKERLAKFVFREDFDASFIGRLMMRKFVHEVTGMEYDRIEFSRDLKGKPYWRNTINGDSLGNNLHVDFNVSHQGSYSVLVGLVATPTPSMNECVPRVGVDVMKIEYTGGKPLDEFFRLMTSNFSWHEWRHIKGYQSDRDRLAAFMRHWCLKESYVKNVGVGITIDLKEISFSTKSELKQNAATTDTVLEINGQLMNKWTFHEYLIDSEHIATVSIENAPPNYDTLTVPFKLIDFDELMKNARPLHNFDDIYCQQVLSKEYKCRTE